MEIFEITGRSPGLHLTFVDCFSPVPFSPLKFWGVWQDNVLSFYFQMQNEADS